MLSRLLILPGVDHAVQIICQFVLARAEAQMVYGAARELNNECTRNTLKHHLFT